MMMDILVTVLSVLVGVILGLWQRGKALSQAEQARDEAQAQAQASKVVLERTRQALKRVQEAQERELDPKRLQARDYFDGDA